MRILLVDESRESLDQARSILADLQMKCALVTAASDREAFDRVEAEAVDLVLLDMQRPDGLDVLRQLRSRHRDVQVLMLMDFRDPGNARRDVLEGFELGAVDFIAKPFDKLEFSARVRAALRSRMEIIQCQRAGEEMREAKALLEGILDAIPATVVIQDTEHQVIGMNQTGYRLFNLTQEQVAGRKCYELLGRTSACTPCATEKAWRTKKLEQLEKYVPELGLYLDCRSAPILDLNGEARMVVELFYDVTERRQMEEQLRQLTMYDSLTGLYNRAYFELEMRRLDVGRDDPISLVICDVDGLKLVNDTLGHDAGDRLLQAAASVLKVAFREGDVVARIGGDEFAVLLPRTKAAVVEEVVGRVRDETAAFNAMFRKLPLHVSIGYAAREGTRVSLEEIFKEADDDMYRDKLQHREKVRNAIIQTFLEALEQLDHITMGHAERMQQLVTHLASAMGLPDACREDLQLLARFHDIGKVGIPDRILFKPGALTPEERAEMQRHCEVGYRIAQWAPDLTRIAECILLHHEWWNGNGYPMGMKGEDVLLVCRILSIADAYDAMTSDRPYRKAMSHADAVAELRRCAGTQFDPELVAKFVSIWSGR